MISTEEATRIMEACVRAVAPEADLQVLDPDASMREEIDLDSLDFLAMVAAIRQRTGYQVPDAAFPELDTFAGAVAHLATHLATHIAAPTDPHA